MFKHGKTVVRLIRNLHGNPSGTFYYVRGLLKFLKQLQAKINEAEICLVRIEMESGPIVVAVTVDDLLGTAPNKAAMKEFHTKMAQKYNIKRLGRPSRYLGWHFHYTDNGIELSQRLMIDKTLHDADMINDNGKHTPYPSVAEYHPPDENVTLLPGTAGKYKQLVGDLRLHAAGHLLRGKQIASGAR